MDFHEQLSFQSNGGESGWGHLRVKSSSSGKRPPSPLKGPNSPSSRRRVQVCIRVKVVSQDGATSTPEAQLQEMFHFGTKTFPKHPRKETVCGSCWASSQEFSGSLAATNSPDLNPLDFSFWCQSMAQMARCKAAMLREPGIPA